MKTSDFYYYLPPERIAQAPVEPRHDSRLMVVNRKNGNLKHAVFKDLKDYLDPGDLLVINQTRVILARIFGRKATGGKVELLLIKKLAPQRWCRIPKLL
jgi:S-adenosylmethionine:tRNA ribosyltransferase-isomerase